MLPISVIILTQNEEENIPYCLKSVIKESDDVWIVDSFSTDKTIEIAKSYGVKVLQNKFIDWAQQRNWALENVTFKYKWVFFVDADEVITDEFWNELRSTFNSINNDFIGLYVCFNYYFMGKKLKYAYGHPYVLRIFKKGHVSYKGEGAREYMVIKGKTAKMKTAIVHYDRRGLGYWIDKQNKNAFREAVAILQKKNHQNTYIVEEKNIDRKRLVRIYLREKVWSKMPRYWRAFFYFKYRYFLRGGFLDGLPGFVYCFLHALWYPILIDAKVTELELVKNENINDLR